MVCVLVCGDDRPDRLLDRWFGGRPTPEEVRLPVGGGAYTLLTLPDRLLRRRGRRASKKINRLLLQAGATELLFSQALVRAYPQLPEALGPRQGGPSGGYAALFLGPMLQRAATLCGLPPARRSLAIVDLGGGMVGEDLLLEAAQVAGRLSVVTAAPESFAQLAEAVFEQTGLPIQVQAGERAEADIVLLLQCGEGFSVRAKILLNPTAQSPRIVDGRCFRSVLLKLPQNLQACLPKQLTEPERLTLLWRVLGDAWLQSLPVGQLI
ncbi:MAG: hypothetical protein GXX99_07115 [Clostridiales bacterium]|nr:hypothetical protein [Clostridiales bacterium]